MACNKKKKILPKIVKKYYYIYDTIDNGTQNKNSLIKNKISSFTPIGNHNKNEESFFSKKRGMNRICLKKYL